MGDMADFSNQYQEATCSERSRTQSGEGYSRNRSQCFGNNKQQTVYYLREFKTFYLNRGFLSDKQKAIINSNYPGGYSQFISDLNHN